MYRGQVEDKRFPKFVERELYIVYLIIFLLALEPCKLVHFINISFADLFFVFRNCDGGSKYFALNLFWPLEVFKVLAIFFLQPLGDALN